jgi:hypothetical protein
MWQDLVREALRLAVGKRWQQCIIPDLEVLDLRDGAWLRLEEKMLQLFPGTSSREGMVWMRGTPIDEIVTAVMGPKVPQDGSAGPEEV